MSLNKSKKKDIESLLSDKENIIFVRGVDLDMHRSMCTDLALHVVSATLLACGMIVSMYVSTMMWIKYDSEKNN